MLDTYIISLVLFVIVSFLLFRVLIKKDYQNKAKLSPISYILEILIFAIHANLSYLFLPIAWPFIPPLPQNSILIFGSIISIAIGLAILVCAFFNLGYKPTLGSGDKLNTSGIYSYSRNPQLLGYGMILFSVVILYPSLYSLGWFFSYVLSSYFMIQSEEEFLHGQYADEYKKYCEKVPRVIKL